MNDERNIYLSSGDIIVLGSVILLIFQVYLYAFQIGLCYCYDLDIPTYNIDLYKSIIAIVFFSVLISYHLLITHSIVRRVFEYRELRYKSLPLKRKLGKFFSLFAPYLFMTGIAAFSIIPSVFIMILFHIEANHQSGALFYAWFGFLFTISIPITAKMEEAKELRLVAKFTCNKTEKGLSKLIINDLINIKLVILILFFLLILSTYSGYVVAKNTNYYSLTEIGNKSYVVLYTTNNNIILKECIYNDKSNKMEILNYMTVRPTTNNMVFKNIYVNKLIIKHVTPSNIYWYWHKFDKFLHES